MCVYVCKRIPLPGGGPSQVNVGKRPVIVSLRFWEENGPHISTHRNLGMNKNMVLSPETKIPNVLLAKASKMLLLEGLKTRE